MKTNCCQLENSKKHERKIEKISIKPIIGFDQKGVKLTLKDISWQAEISAQNLIFFS